MKFWITGGDGLVGSALKSLCDTLKISYVATTKEQADLTDATTLLKFAETLQPTHIINCAAYTKVDLAEKNPLLAFAVNGEGPGNLARISMLLKTKFVHISTNYVFEGNLPFYGEEALGGPAGVYGKSKWEGEKKALEHNPGSCIVRTSWVFGKSGNNLISSLWGFLKTNDIVRVASDQIASLTYARDLAQTLLLLRDQSGIFHFSNAGKASRYEVALELLAIAKNNKIPLACQKIEPVLSSSFGPSAPRPLSAALSTEKYNVLFGPPRHWKEVLEEYVLYDT